MISQNLTENTIKFDSKKILLELSNFPEDRWTVDDAMKGVSIMGSTGSGKTTSSGKKLALNYLQAGWGGIVLCAKPDEADLWDWYCRKSGRHNDLIRFGKNSVHEEKGEVYNKGLDGQTMIFNPIDYEKNRGGEGAGETLNLTNIFMNIYRMGNRISGESDTKDERYWDTALKRCLNRVIELIKLADEDLTYSNMIEILTSAVSLDAEELDKYIKLIKEGRYMEVDQQFKNYCGQCILIAYHDHVYNRREEAGELWESYRSVKQYFTRDIPAMGEKTRTTITESFMGLAEPFMSGILYKHFSGATNVKPEWTYLHQKIIVIDFPIKEFLDSGIIAQSVFKLLFQQALERRKPKIHPVPVFIWCDEAHYFVNPYDQIFLTTARSSRTSTVYLSQNISNYFAVMGGSDSARSKVYSLMGNLATKIFHANSDVETNEYASKLIGESIQYMDEFSQSKSFGSFDYGTSESKSGNYHPQVPVNKFTTLKSGGENYENEVEAIVFTTGKKWADGTNFIETTFTQNFENYMV